MYKSQLAICEKQNIEMHGDYSDCKYANANRTFISNQPNILIKKLLLKLIYIYGSSNFSNIFCSSCSPAFSFHRSFAFFRSLSLFVSLPALSLILVFSFVLRFHPLKPAGPTSCHFAALKFLWCVQFPT